MTMGHFPNKENLQKNNMYFKSLFQSLKKTGEQKIK